MDRIRVLRFCVEVANRRDEPGGEDATGDSENAEIDEVAAGKGLEPRQGMKSKCHENDPKRRRVKDPEIVGCGNEGPGDGNGCKQDDIKPLFEKGDDKPGSQECVIPKWKDHLVLHGQAPVARLRKENSFEILDVGMQRSRRPVFVSLKKEIGELSL